MHLAAVQFKSKRENLERSRIALVGLVELAAPKSDLVVCPEMATPGYVFESVDSVRQLAELPEGSTFQALSKVAERHRAWVVCGFPERCPDTGLLFNSAMVIDEFGELVHVYRKSLLYEADEVWATPGRREYPLLRTPFGSLSVGICMDMNDPAFVAWLQRMQPDVLAFPTNWLDEGEPVWPYWVWRLQGIHSALVAANSYGPDGPISFCGTSAIVRGPRVLAGLGPSGDGVARARLD